jgi:HK97 family phage major capsid protein
VDLKKMLNDLVKKQKTLFDTAEKENRVFTVEEKTEFDALQGQIDGVKAQIAAKEALDASQGLLDAPASSADSIPAARIDVGAEPLADKPFKNIAEQLIAIRNHAQTGHADERLLKVQNASGATAGSGSDGGFAIQKDFGGAMMESAVKDDPLLSLIDSYPVSGKADRVVWQELAEDNIGTTVFGGIRVYWAEEGGTATATKPKMREQEIKLQKLMGFYYNTLEHETDSSFNSTIVTRGFTTAIRRELAAAVYNGDGVGKPLGLLQALCLVSAAKESGQTAATVVWENISKMYNRARGSKSKFVWLIHPDVLPQLENMVKVIGTGGVPVYLPSALPDSMDTLRGRRIYESDQCQALGTKGDIMFINPKEYVLIYKGGIETASSIHVGFLTAENCFRFIFRCNGFPKQRSALTLKNSSTTRSSVISLDTRG